VEVAAAPDEPHDVPLDLIATERELVTNGFARSISPVATIAGSITAMILGALALGVIVTCIGTLVLDSVEPEEPGARALVELDLGKARVVSGELTEARSVWIDRKCQASACRRRAGSMQDAKGADKVD
jgi:hypothetical protein